MEEPYLITQHRKGVVFAGRGENDIILPLDKYNKLLEDWEDKEKLIKDSKQLGNSCKNTDCFRFHRDTISLYCKYYATCNGYTTKNTPAKIDIDKIEFQTLGEKEREILLKALNIDKNNLECQFCKKKVSYKSCCILPALKTDKLASILCDSVLCMTTYFTEAEDID